MRQYITERKDFPKAPYYVVGKDNFFSNWHGKPGVTNKFVLPCKDLEQAERVADNAKRRGESRNVRIVENPPRIRPNTEYALLTEETAPAWYRQGAFAK